MNKSGSHWEVEKLLGPCGRNWNSSVAGPLLRDSFTRKRLSHCLILLPYGGRVMTGPCMGTLNHFARVSQNKYLDGAGAIPNYPCGKKQSSTDAHNVGGRRRHQNT